MSLNQFLLYINGRNLDWSQFVYNKNWFRLMAPNGFTYNRITKTWTFPEPGKKYPLILFFHGNGETGTDNNNQLHHGGQQPADKMQNQGIHRRLWWRTQPEARLYRRSKCDMNGCLGVREGSLKIRIGRGVGRLGRTLFRCGSPVSPFLGWNRTPSRLAERPL